VQQTTADLTPRVLHPVWDRTTRWFHWINVLAILVLAAIGTAFLYEDELGLSHSGVMLLKTVHVYAGYVFAINLLWRLVWAFIGNAHARWKSFLPFRKGFVSELGAFVSGFRAGKVKAETGHDPLGRLMVTLLLVLMLAQAATGLILAGTDLYKPPFGGQIAEWVTGGDPARLAQLQPGSKDFVVPEKYDEMRAFRKPVKEVHEVLFYVLLASIVLHIVGVVTAEVRLRQGLVSAMITGKKSLPPKKSDGDS